MTPETFMPAHQTESRHDEGKIARLQLEAAESAQTVGAFRTGFRSRIKEALAQGDIRSEIQAERRMDIVDKVTDGHADIRLDATEAGVLGWNRIGAGRSGIHLSKHTFGTLESANQKNDVKQVVAHEAAHGKQVQLKGALLLDGEEVTHEELYEGDAEIAGNEAVGLGMTEHRAGQPEELYEAGQNASVRIIQTVGRSAFDKALRGDGDLSALQAELNLAMAA